MKRSEKPAQLTSRAMYWQQHIEAWSTSGLTQSKYCEDADVSLHAFGYWRTRLNHITKKAPQLAKPKPERTFKEVIIKPSKPSSQSVSTTKLCAMLPNEIKVEIPLTLNDTELSRVIKLLGGCS